MDRSLLEAALVGYQAQLTDITIKIADLQKRLNGRVVTTATLAPGSGIAEPQKKRHRISAEGRARIAAAQKKRWAAANKA